MHNEDDSAPPLTLSDLTGLGELEEFGAMPREQKIETTLAQPQLPGAMKLGAINTITKTRMRHQFANLLSSEMPNIQAALHDLRKENPKVYIDQMVQLAQFALPQLKSVEVDQGSESARKAQDLTLDELLGALNDTSVVSVQ